MNILRFLKVTKPCPICGEDYFAGHSHEEKPKWSRRGFLMALVAVPVVVKVTKITRCADGGIVPPKMVIPASSVVINVPRVELSGSFHFYDLRAPTYLLYPRMTPLMAMASAPRWKGAGS